MLAVYVTDIQEGKLVMDWKGLFLLLLRTVTLLSCKKLMIWKWHHPPG